MTPTMNAYYQPQPLRLPHRSIRSTRAASLASSLAYQESSIPDVDSDTSDVETEIGRDAIHTPLTSPGGPRFEDLPPSYEQVQVEAIVNRHGALGREEEPPPPPFEDLSVNRLTLNRLSIHNNTQDEGTSTPRPRPRPQSYSYPDDDAPPPFETQQSAEEDLLERALRFTHPLHNTSNLESLPATKLPRPIAIPQFQSHVEQAGSLAFFPSYAPTLEAFGIQPALFLAFLRGLTTVFSALRWPDYDEDATWHLMEMYLTRANAFFFAPRGLMVRIVDMEGLLGALRISENRVGLRNALLRDVMRPGATEGERVEMLDPWVEPLIWEGLPTDPLPDLPPEAAAQYADEKAEARQWAALIEEEEEAEAAAAAEAANNNLADERGETASLAPSTSSSSSKRSINTPPSSASLTKSLPPVPPSLPIRAMPHALTHRPLPPLPGALGSLPLAVQRAATYAVRAQAQRTRFCPGPFPRPGPFPCVPFPTAGPLPPLVPSLHRSYSSIHHKSRGSSVGASSRSPVAGPGAAGPAAYHPSPPPWAQSWTQWGNEYSRKWEDWGQQFSKRCEEYASDFGKRAVAWNRELQEKRRLGNIGLGAGLGHGNGGGADEKWQKKGGFERWQGEKEMEDEKGSETKAPGGRAVNRVQSLNLNLHNPNIRASHNPYTPGHRRGAASESGWGASAPGGGRGKPLRSASANDMHQDIYDGVDRGELKTPDTGTLPEEYGWYTPTSLRTPTTTNAHRDGGDASSSIYNSDNDSDDDNNYDARSTSDSEDSASDADWNAEAELDSIEVAFLRRMKAIEDDATDALRKGKRSRDSIEKERVRAVVAAESERAAAAEARHQHHSHHHMCHRKSSSKRQKDPHSTHLRALKDGWRQSRAANRAARRSSEREMKGLGLPREQRRALRAEQRAAWRVEKDKLKAEWREARRLWREGRREERRERWGAARRDDKQAAAGVAAGTTGDYWGGARDAAGADADANGLMYGGVQMDGLLLWVVVENLE